MNPLLTTRMVSGINVPTRDRDPKAPDWPITPEWREKVKARLDQMDISQAELARRVGCTPAAITNILRDNKQSSYVPAIHRVLGWDPPADPDGSVPTDEDRVLQEIAAIARELPPDVRTNALNFLRSIREAKRKK